MESMLGKGNTHFMLVGMQSNATTLENRVGVFQKIGSQPT